MNEPIDLNFAPRQYQIDVLKAIENQGYKKVLLNWHRRCLSGDTHIILSNGSFKLLKDIKVGEKILSWNGKEFVEDTVKHIWKTEVKKTKIVQSSGFLPITSSIDHVFACKDKSWPKIHWLPIKDIHPKRVLLNYAGIQFGKINNPELAEFWGYMICDGYISGYQQPKFTNTNLDILKRVEQLAINLFNMKVIWRSKGNGYDLGMSNGTMGGGETKNKVKELFRIEGLDVPKNIRNLPSVLWHLDAQSLGRFFSAMISSDGNIYIHKPKKFELDRGMASPVEITLSCGESYQHAWGIYWLLRKLGIKPQNPYHERKSNWKIRISSCDSIKYLLSFGPVYGKTDKQQEALKHLEQTHKKRIINDSCFSSMFSIKDGTEEELYDIETENHHNFIANGYIVHNSGKDVVAFNVMIRAALKKIGLYLYCLPTYKQGKKVIWDGFLSSGSKFMDFFDPRLVESKNISELKITLINGSIIQIVGSNDAEDKLVGTNPQGIVFSEWSRSEPSAYTYLRPAILANKGWVIFISTPFGRNFMYEMSKVAIANPKDWYYRVLTVEDTDIITKEEIDNEIKEGLISPDLVLQEYYGSFDAGAEGSYFAKYIQQMRLDDRITSVPWDPQFKVHSAWDLGVHDKTCIVMWQSDKSGAIRVIDYYENCDKGLDHYAKIISSKPYVWGFHWAPHDIAVRELSTGLSRIELAKRMGLPFRLLPSIPIDDGIELVKVTLPKVWIDEVNCKQLISSLELYRRIWDEQKKIYHNKPFHDSHSDRCDAVRYACMAIPKCVDGTSAKELDKRYLEALQGVQDHNANLPREYLDNY